MCFVRERKIDSSGTATTVDPAHAGRHSWDPSALVTTIEKLSLKLCACAALAVKSTRMRATNRRSMTRTSSVEFHE